MELFGYVCSPLCKAKAQSHGILVPEYAGQKSVREARLWRRVGWTASAFGVVAGLAAGFWFWYAWFGSIPKPVFSVRFPEMSFVGQSVIAGSKKDQFIFLHGNTLARYTMKPSREIWSVRLLDRQQFARQADAELKVMQQRNLRLADQGVEDLPRIPPADKLIDQLERDAEAAMTLFVRGQDIWVESPGQLFRYDWETGKSAKELSLPANASVLGTRGEDLTLLDPGVTNPSLIHVNLNTCDTSTEDINGRKQPAMLAKTGGGGKSAQPTTMAGLPLGIPGRDMNQPMDPAKVAEQAQHLSLPQRLALPATLANSLNQERQLAILNDRPTPNPTADRKSGAQDSSSLVPTPEGFIELSVRVLESRIIQRTAVKPAAPQRKLDDGLTAGNGMEAANGILSDMQHERGGDVVSEDQSRYEVTLRRPGNAGSWTGEVLGPPRLFPLASVAVLAAGQTVFVFDKSSRLLWKSSLSFEMPELPESTDAQSSRFGQGPCVERDGALYIFDKGYLACFDLLTGNRRWGLPSVGVAGLFFDDRNMVYVNTTSAGPDKLRYSRQIDLSQKVSSVVLKVDARNGKILWKTEQLGLVSYVSGKLVLTVESFQPPDEDEPGSADTGFETPPYLRIRRLQASSGRAVWEHFEQRAPLDIGFEGNMIRLVFRKEVEVLRFLVL